MSRTTIALAIGLPGFIAYLVGVATLADLVFPLHWTIQALYFLVAGVAWTAPATWLIVWASRK